MSHSKLSLIVAMAMVDWNANPLCTLDLFDFIMASVGKRVSCPMGQTNIQTKPNWFCSTHRFFFVSSFSTHAGVAIVPADIVAVPIPGIVVDVADDRALSTSAVHFFMRCASERRLTPTPTTFLNRIVIWGKA